MAIFDTKMTLEELEKKIDNVVDEEVPIGATFINFKLQKRLIEEQNSYNKKQLFWSRALTIGTWLLVIATLLLIKFK